MTEHLIGKVGDGKRMAVIAICNLTMVQNKAYATHLQFAYKLAKDNPEFQFILFTPYRMTIANFRNVAANAALECEAEYLMFIDDDAVLLNHPSIFKELKDKIDDEPNKHIIMPIVYVRGYPFNPMFFKYVTDEKIKETGKILDFYTDFKEDIKAGKADANGLLEVAAIGCHTCLIKTEVFKTIEKPYFLTGLNHTEDTYFCMKCHDFIQNIGIFVDTTITIPHLLDPMWVDDTNVEYLKKLYEDLKMTGTINIKEEFGQPNQLKRDLDVAGEEFEK